MAVVRSSVNWIGGLVVLALILSGWVLRTESASSGGTVNADVSAQVKVTFSGLRYNRTTQTYDTIATLTNTSTAPIQAPLELHVVNITPATVALQNPGGTASDGHSYVTVPLPTGELAPAATVTNVVLRFNNPDKVQFTFTHHVFGALAASNTPPVANAGPDQSARVGETVTLDGSASTDAEGDPLTYDWTLPGVPASAATLADATTVNPQLTLNQPGAYTAQLVVHDGQAESAPDTVTVSTTNTAPVAHAGPNQTAPVNTTVQLDGSQSSDVDGNALTFQWTLVRSPDGSSAELVNPTTVNPRLTLDRVGEYVVQLIVNDGQADSDPASVTISTENSPPVAKAGPAQTVAVGATVQLNGAGSSDADDDPLTYQWTLTSAPAGSIAELANDATVNPSFTADKVGAYVAQLIVNDGKVNSDPDTVQISTENSQPVANAGPDQTAEVGETVTLDGSGSSDADGNLLSYLWALTTRPDASQATLQNADRKLAEFIPDVAGQYVAQLIVNDGVLSSLPDTATITVTPPTSTNRDPQITSSPVTTATVGQSYSYDVNATDDDGDTLSYVLNVAPADMSINADSGLIAWLPTTAGSVPVTVAVSDGQGGLATQSFSIQVQPENLPPLPPAPEAVAPPIDPTVATTTFAATEFLYTGSNPIQTGVAPGTIEAKRAAVLRGRVLDKNNAPLSGVTVTINNRPEFGQTVSRADGWFDLAVNGGGYLTVNYQKTGYLPAQRQVNAPWQDFVVLDDVVLIPLDSQVTTVNLAAPTMQVARASVINDASGSRQATLLFPAGTTATMTLPNGATQPLSALQVRATEYTVGTNGPQAMPAELPPTSAYTYAVELSVDEAIAAGAKTVQFNQPIPFYVDNFLNFPVGIQVPLAYYDRDKAAWVPTDDGRVIKVLSIANGVAQVDTTGDNAADNGVAIGMTEAERQTLAQNYPTGKTLQRVAVRHFSPHDLNYGIVAALGAIAANVRDAIAELFQKLDDSCLSGGSVIECENQTLGEFIPVVGTGLNLNYRSDRVPGRKAANTLTIPLSGASVPSVLKRIELEITVAGRIIKQTLPAAPNQTHTFTWDGLDAYGRALQGTQPVSIRIGYVYDGFYALPPAMARTFGAASGQRIPGDIPARQEVTLWQDQKSSVSVAPDFRQVGVGGWSLNVHHVYDPIGQILYQGDGSRRSAQKLDNIITTIAGTGARGFSGDGGPAIQADLLDPTQVVATADGSVFIADTGNHRIRRVGLDGIITTIAGTGTRGFSGDGSLATQAQMFAPQGVALAADGSVLIADSGNHRIRRVGPDGIITTIAGTGETGFSGDGGLATQARVSDPRGIAVAADGSVLIAVRGQYRIRRIGLDGIITTVAGNGQLGFNGDGGPATLATLYQPTDVAVAADGSVLIADYTNFRVRRVGPDGIITTIAGISSADYSGDGGLATQAALKNPSGIAVTADGSVLIADEHRAIRRIGPDGIITTFAGGRLPEGNIGDGGPATQAYLYFPEDVAVAADGNVLIADTNNHRIRRVGSPVAGFNGLDIAIASEDGRLLYRFNPEGRHLSTVDTLTKTVLYTFGYDSAGRLTSITDANNNVTTIERDGSGNPTAIVAPFGQRTTLTVNGDGYLASVANPAGETHQLIYTADGLLTTFTDPKGNASQFTYDALGRLQRDANAAAGSQNLARAELADGYTVTRSTALNRTTTYIVEDLPIGDRQRKVRAPDGTETVTLLGADGSAKITAPDGSVTESLDGPDPRFGMQAPITTSHKVTTGGLTATASSSATVNPANPTDPLTFTSLTRTATINNRTATSTFDAATRRTDSRSPANRQSYSILDTKGRVIESGVTGIDPVRMSYDSRGRLASVAQGAGANERVTTFNYNAAGYLASATDALGQSGSLSYDPAGRVLAQTLANGSVIDFAYDANGNLISLTPPGKPAHGFTYNAVNLATAYTPPAVAGSGANSTAYAYNADKQVTQITRPDGGMLDYGYDAAGRLSTLSIPAGQYGYAYNTAGQLDSITAPGGVTLDYGYNGSLLTGVTWSGGINGSVGYGYDNDFRVNAITVNGVNAIAYQYDADSLLTRAGDLTLTRSSQNGLLTGTALGSATETYTYNSFGEMSGYTGQYSSTNLLAFTYTRDKLGRITQKAETVQGTTTTYDYRYDAIGQLIEVKQNGSVAAIYSYDPNGNRLSKTGPGINETGSYDAQDRMLSYAGATYSYTANGELQSKVQGGQTTTYNYDALGNLRQVTLPNGTQIEYLIDGQNRRIGKKVNNVLVQGFLYQGQLQPAAELDGSGNVVSRFIYATGVNVPDYLIKNGQTYRMFKDHLGSPRLVVNTATGAIEQRMDFDEYGKVLADSNPGFQPFGFAGGIYDRDTGLVRFGARDYDAESGRWMVKDLIGIAGGSSNFYKYAHNEPINSIDYSGKFYKDIGNTVSSIIDVFLFARSILEGGIRSAGDFLAEEGIKKGIESVADTPIEKVGASAFIGAGIGCFAGPMGCYGGFLLGGSVSGFQELMLASGEAVDRINGVGEDMISSGRYYNGTFTTMLLPPVAPDFKIRVIPLPPPPKPVTVPLPPPPKPRKPIGCPIVQ